MAYNSLILTDVTGVYTNEVIELAKYLGLERRYKFVKFFKNFFGSSFSPKSLERITKKYLKGKNVNEIKECLTDKKIFYPGARKSIKKIREYHKLIGISDSPLLELNGTKENFDDLYTTTIFERFNGKIKGIKETKTKVEYAKKIIEKKQPNKVIAIVNGKNDKEFAKYIKSINGKLLAVNSPKPIRKLADECFKTIIEVTDYLEACACT